MSQTLRLRTLFSTLSSRSSRAQQRFLHTTTARMSESCAPRGIDAAPAENQLIQHEDTTYKTIREGLAYILVPPNARTSTDPKTAAAAAAAAANKGGEQDAAAEQVQSVFYNPIQQFNRDLSVLAIKAFGEDVMAKRQRKRQQTRAKKDRKRQAGSRDDDGNAHGDAAESKRRKGNDGEAVAAENEEAPDPTKAGQEQQQEQQQQQQQQQQLSPPPPPPPPSRFRILDALSATGLRALRYASEIPFATSVVSNDMSEAAVASIALNVRHNKLTSKITPSTGNAIGHMYQAAFATPSSSSSEAWAQGKYDVVDLDPYGTAVPFLDAAIQSLNDGGLLCVTCTDAGVFASCGYVEKTFSLYGGLPVKGPHSHEAGLRLILHSIATSAAKYGIAIEPLLSLSIDYYARVFVRIKRSPAEVKFLAGKTMLVHSCDAGCGSWQTQFLARHVAQNGRFNFKHLSGQSNSDKNCPHCGFKTHVAGPMWGGPIHNPFFIQRILDALPNLDTHVYQTTLRIEGMLTSALDELDVLPSVTAAAADTATAPLIPSTPPHLIDPFPFFFIPSNLSKILHCRAPSEAAVKGALRRLGYVATRSHCKPGTIKTQAPFSVVWEIFREWIRQKAPIKADKVVEKMPGFRILQGLRVVDGPEADAETEGDEAPRDVGKIRADEAREAVEGGKRSSPQPVDVGKFRVVFDEQLGKDVLRKKLTRYQVNPRDNWGPMARAKGHA